MNKFSMADSVCRSYQLNLKQVLPIALPECARYSSLSDKLESSANFYLYVTLGTSYGNFSIGHFQMKPSFIENLEKEVAKYPGLKQFNFINDFGKNVTDATMIRKKRLSRLDSEWWQLQYLCCFYKVMEAKFATVSFENDVHKFRFFAAAYNRGFHLTEKQIREWMDKPAFPTGKIDASRNFSYASVAVEFLEDLQLKNYH
jgi:hypothetical protein